ncbi:hypothetical protein ACFLRU_00670 [Bacteroidota bacterium]
MKQILYFLVGILVLSSCTENEIFKFNKEFSIELNQSILIPLNDTETENLKIQFHELVEYSICPPNVNCVWAGRAIVNLKINDSETIQLALLDDEIPSKKNYEEYEISLLNVTSNETTSSIQLIIKKIEL